MRLKTKFNEKDIQNQILAYLNGRGIFCWSNNSVGIFDSKKGIFRRSLSRYSLRGVSDILGLFEHRFLAIEVKSEKGRPSPEQLEFISRINQEGGLAFIARSVSDVEGYLRNTVKTADYAVPLDQSNAW